MDSDRYDMIHGDVQCSMAVKSAGAVDVLIDYSDGLIGSGGSIDETLDARN